jgi:hypothetical protein
VNFKRRGETDFKNPIIYMLDPRRRGEGDVLKELEHIMDCVMTE